MITPSFGLTATERVLPKLALDFTTATLDPRITFTRTTGASNPATYVNSSGYITAATNNQPRFDYGPTTLSCKGLLIEEAKTNSFLYSQTFSTGWTVSQCSITNVTLPSGKSPDNGTTAGKIVLNNTVTPSSSRSAFQEFIGLTGVNTVSVYSKAAEFSKLRVSIRTASGVGADGAEFDLSTGSVISVNSAISATIEPLIDGWYRCVATFDFLTGATTPRVYFASVQATGNGTSGIYVWGAQLEAGAFATSYIPTTTTALTRNADVATMTGTNFSSWFNASEGAFVARAAYVGLATSKPIFTVNTDGSNYFGVLTAPSTVADARGVMLTSGATQTAINIASVFTAGSFSKVCYTYKTNSCAFSANGLATSSDPTATIPTVDKLEFGKLATIQSSLWISNLNYYPQRLTNAEVQAFSK